jgi:hypothetical protein
MSIEDRVRAAARARTDLVRQIRPLELPDELPAHAQRPRAARRWLSWGAPIGAAALVTALALVLVMLRQAGGPQSGPAAPAPAPPASASIPRYYVALTYTSSKSAQIEAVVGDDRTGSRIAVVTPSASQSFYGVTAAADDRTFVLANYSAAEKETTWYLLRITPGAAHPAQLTKLPIKPLAAQVNGLALSPDGRELAVMWRTATTPTNAVTQLAVYSLSSGAVLHTWNTPGPNNNMLGVGANGVDLTWVNGDRNVDFLWSVSDKDTIRALDVTAAGQDLMADSRLVMRVPASTAPPATVFKDPCASSLIASDRTVICGATGVSDKSADSCSAVPPSFVSYSLATGKQLKVLYRYQGECQTEQTEVLWTDPTGNHVLVLIFRDLKDTPASAPADNLFGLIANGHFTPLPTLVAQTGFSSGAENGLGGIAF